MPAAGSPIACRMPISRVLNATTIVSVPTMLNAATIMMQKITSPMRELLELERAEERAVLHAATSRSRYSGPSTSWMRAATTGASHASFTRTAIPDTALPSPVKRCAASRSITMNSLS